MRKLLSFILLLAITASPALASPNRTVVAKTSSYYVLTSDSGTVFTNEGATSQVVFVLPTPAAGLEYEFVIVAAQSVRVQVDNQSTEEVIYEQGGTFAGHDTVGLRYNSVGSTLRLLAVNSTTWVVMQPVQDNSWEAL